METSEIHDIVIVGGGICGLATGLALHRVGIKSIILEKSRTLRATGAAIIMQPNGWKALDHLGVASALRQTAIIIESGAYVSVTDGRRFALPFGGGEVRSLRRTDLIKALANELPTDTIFCGRGVVSVQIDLRTSLSILQIDDGSVLKARMLIGCDGVNSVVGEALKLNSMKLSPTSAIRGFTHFENGHDFLPEFLIWTSENVTLGHIPVTDKLVYWFVTRERSSQDSTMLADQALLKEYAIESIKGYPQHAVDLVKNSDVNSLHITSLRYRAPWDLLTANFRKGSGIVLGDAMHAMGPFLAQGGSASLEDAVILAKSLARKLRSGPAGSNFGLSAPKTMEETLDRYLQQRQKRVFWISLQTRLIDLMTGASSNLMKLFSIFLLSVLYRDPIAHTRFDCGRV